MKTRTLSMTSGWVTDPGTWTRNEESLAYAGNVDLCAAGVIAKRRGFSSNTLNAFSGLIFAMHSSPALERDLGAGALLLAVGNSGAASSNGFRVGTRASTFAAMTGTRESSMAYRPKLATGTDGLDVVTGFGIGTLDGLLVMDYPGLSSRYLGVPRGMGLDRLATATSGVVGFLPAGYSCRYAVTFSLGDPLTNGTQEGAPGMTSVFQNTTVNAVNVAASVLLPRMYGTVATALTADTYWLNVYRSAGQATTLGEPPSELALVFRKQLSAADIAAGAVAFTDIVPDVARGANLYTNLLTGEDGIAGRGFVNSNEPPPVAADVATWADCLWVANLQDFPTQEVQLISVGGTGLVAADTFTVDGVAFTAIAGVPVPPADNFQISGGGTASVNQRETALNLVDAINRSVNNNSCWAYYVAGVVGQPGRIVLKARTFGSNISASTSRAAAFRIGSQDNEATPSAIGFSKELQPHAHPEVNRFTLGRGDAEVMRIVPYRDSLFVFKADGLWRVTGDGFRNFSANEFDLTFRLVSREAVCQLDDAVYAWGVRGLARITDGGVEYIDAPIRNQVLAVVAGVLQTSLASFTFCVPRPQDGVVLFFYPQGDPAETGDPSGPVPSSEAFAWHARTQTWSLWTWPASAFTTGYLCGTANVVDAISSLGVWELAPVNGCWVHNERRSFTAADFTDPDMSASPPTMAATPVDLIATWRSMSAAALGVAQWLKARLEFAPTEAARQNQSAAVTVTMANDNGFATADSVSVGASGANFAPSTAVIPVSQDAARGHALVVQLQQATAAGCFIIGLNVDYRDVSTKGTR